LWGAAIALSPTNSRTPHQHPGTQKNQKGLAWTGLELLSYVLLRPTFIRLLDGNPKLAGNDAKKKKTATQMLPRVVCFVHNVVQVTLRVCVLGG
jgi:hypothetical protein